MRASTTRMDGDPPPFCKTSARCRAVLRKGLLSFVNFPELGCLNSSGAALPWFIFFSEYKPKQLR